MSVFKERIDFYELKQVENEPVKDWYVRVKNKAIHCKFGNTLNEVLKDKFVSGLQKTRILDRVCEEEHAVSLDKILEVALKNEASLIPYSSINRVSWQPSKEKREKKVMQCCTEEVYSKGQRRSHSQGRR